MSRSCAIGGLRKIALVARRIGLRPLRLRCILSLAVMAGMLHADVLTARFARAQDDWNADADRASVKRQNRLPGQVVMGPAVMRPADVERWISGGKSRGQIEQTFESQLAVQADSVALVCELSGAQSQKLELAGHGDVKRFFESVEELKEKFRQAGQDQQKFNELVREVGPLQMKMQAGFFGDSSLYRKVLKETLDRAQSERYEQQELERRKFRYEAKIELVLSNLETTVALRAEQRQRVVKLLLAETEPPKKFGQLDYYVVLYQARKLGEAKLKPIFDDAQWQALNKVLDQAQRMEPHLKANGFLP